MASRSRVLHLYAVHTAASFFRRASLRFLRSLQERSVDQTTTFDKSSPYVLKIMSRLDDAAESSNDGIAGGEVFGS